MTRIRFERSGAFQPPSQPDQCGLPWDVPTTLRRWEVGVRTAPRRGSVLEGPGIERDVDGVLAQDLEGDDLEGPFVGSGPRGSSSSPRTLRSVTAALSPVAEVLGNRMPSSDDYFDEWCFEKPKKEAMCSGFESDGGWP